MKVHNLRLLNQALTILRSEVRSLSEIELLANFIISEYKDLAVYLSPMTIEGIHQVMQVCSLEEYNPEQHVFYKGEASNKFYLILFGSICVYNLNKANVITFSTTLTAGKKLGEQGLTTGSARSMGAKAMSKTYLLVIARSAFKQYLQKVVLKELESQLAYIDRYFPSIANYGSSTRVRIAYSMHTVNCRRNKALLVRNEPGDAIFFIDEGECSIVTEVSKTKDKCVVKMGKGSCFGEECGLLGNPANHSVKATSEYARLFFIRKVDAKRVIPEEVIAVLLKNYHLKQRNRKLLKRVARPVIPIDENVKDRFERYPLASTAARRSICMQHQRTKSSLCVRLDDPLFVGYKKHLKRYRSGVSLEPLDAPKLSRRSSLLYKGESSPTNLRPSERERMSLTPVRL
jgi:CRP-like cAMP-binding protein